MNVSRRDLFKQLGGRKPLRILGGILGGSVFGFMNLLEPPELSAEEAGLLLAKRSQSKRKAVGAPPAGGDAPAKAS